MVQPLTMLHRLSSLDSLICLSAETVILSRQHMHSYLPEDDVRQCWPAEYHAVHVGKHSACCTRVPLTEAHRRLKQVLRAGACAQDRPPPPPRMTGLGGGKLLCAATYSRLSQALAADVSAASSPPPPPRRRSGRSRLPSASRTVSAATFVEMAGPNMCVGGTTI